VIRIALLALILLYAPAAHSQEDEDHERVCPLLTPDLVHAILPEVTGHGGCQVFCQGCGCKGGPGYRDQSHKCVSYADIIQKCGPPPHPNCIAECAPLNAKCDHGRVWLKNTLSKAGLSVRFVAAGSSPAQQDPLQGSDQSGDNKPEH
jgi:hypothetical protein